MPETCRVSGQNKFGEILAFGGFIKKKDICYDARSHELKICDLGLRTADR
jgi:hypothetical protein